MNDDTEKKPGNGETPPSDPELEAEADALLAEARVDAPATAADGGDQAEAPAVPLHQALAQFLDITFNGLLKPRGEYWAMSPGELGPLSKAYANVILKYWPDFDLGVELTCIVVTVTVMGPRLAAHQAARAAAAAEADDAEPEKKIAADKKPAPAKTKGEYRTSE